MKKDREREILRPFAVGANCVRPRAFTERPYENDFLSVGKTCFMKDTPWRVPFVILIFSHALPAFSVLVTNIERVIVRQAVTIRTEKRTLAKTSPAIAANM